MKIIFPVYIGTLYFFNLIIYPQWYLPDCSVSIRCLLAGCFIILTYGSFLLAKYLVNETEIAGQEAGLKANNWDYKYKLIVGAFCLITHLPFINLPILTLGDSHMHAGLPALALAKLDSLCARELHISFRLIFSLCLGLMVVLVVRQRKLIRFVSSLKGFGLIIPAGIIYVILLCRSPILENFGKFEHFFRYPVLGKSLFFSSYAVFGIHEWVGRAIQIVFLFVGALYFSRLIEILSGDKQIGRAGYLVYLLFPPFWDFAHQNYLTGGVLCFSTASMYYMMNYFTNRKSRDIYIAVAIIAAGIMYKRFLIILIPVLYTIALMWSLTIRRLTPKEIKKLILASLLPLGIAIPCLLIFSHLRNIYPYYPQGPCLKYLASPERLLIDLKLIPFAITWPLVFIGIAGLFLALVYKQRAFVLCFSILFIINWFLISASDAYRYVRHNLIGYISITAFITFFIGSICRKLPHKIGLFLLSAVYLSMAFLVLHTGPGETISLRKVKDIFLPYDELFAFIKSKGLCMSRIYAPMKCEPSHFYIAKYSLSDREFLFRKKWDTANFPYENFHNFLLGENFRYVVIPQGPQVEGIIEEYLDEILLSELLNSRTSYTKLYKIFRYGENTLLLLILEKG